jgi:lipopolysaccharide biosynthesis protein
MDVLDALDNAPFFAGSMFWARVKALEPVRKLALRDDDFEPELGQVDGTLAHAMERVFAMAAQRAGFEIATVEELMQVGHAVKRASAAN